MHRIFSIFLIGSIIGSSAMAQQDIHTAVRGDSVFIFLAKTPAVGEGMIVERKGPNDTDFRTLTPGPVRPVLSADSARKILGTDYAFIARSLDAENVQQTLFRLRNDPFRGGILTMLNRKAGRVLGRFFPAGGHQTGETYTYRIRMVNRRGETVKTIEKEIRMVEKKPDSPEGVKTAMERSGIMLNWDYPDWRPEADDKTVQFYLYRSINGLPFQRAGGITLLRLSGTPLRYLDTAVTPGDSVCYYLTAVDAAGLESMPSDHVCAVFRDIVAPAAPLGLKSMMQDNGISLIWNMSPELDVMYYNVYRSPDMSGTLQQINTAPVPVDDPWFVDETGVPGRQYFYAVTAVDSALNESRPCNRIDAWPEDKTPPGMPQQLSAEAADRTVTLTWSPPDDPDLRGFYVYRGFSKDNLYRQTEQMITESRYTDSGTANAGLEPGRRYYYTVEALDSVFNRSEAADVWITIPDDRAPGSPGDVRVSNPDGRCLIIEWDPSPSPDVAVYHVLRATDTDSMAYVIDDPYRRELSDTAVVRGVSYQYIVSAADSAGNISRPSVSGRVLMKDFDPPHGPRFVQAVAGSSGVIIRWEKSAASDLAGYFVYCSDIETGMYRKINSEPVQELTLVDPAGTAGMWYKVRAVDTSGNESGFSPGAASMLQE